MFCFSSELRRLSISESVPTSNSRASLGWSAGRVATRFTRLPSVGQRTTDIVSPSVPRHDRPPASLHRQFYVSLLWSFVRWHWAIRREDYLDCCSLERGSFRACLCPFQALARSAPIRHAIFWCDKVNCHCLLPVELYF